MGILLSFLAILALAFGSSWDRLGTGLRRIVYRRTCRRAEICQDRAGKKPECDGLLFLEFFSRLVFHGLRTKSFDRSVKKGGG